MSNAKQNPAQRDSDIRGVLTALLGALVVVLLVVANIQLASLGGPSNTDSQSGAVSIPPPVQGTSNEVLSEELGELSDDLAAPLNLLRGKLDPLSSLSAGQFAAANSFEDVASSVRRLGSVRQELAQMSAGLGSMVSNTEAMAGSLGESNTTLEGVGRDIGSTNRVTGRLARTMGRVDRSITATGKTTNESLAGMSAGITAMRESISGMSQSLTTETQGMRASLAELNSNMEEFLSLFCILLTSEPECQSASASVSTAPIQRAETMSSRGGLGGNGGVDLGSPSEEHPEPGS
jgi:ABC-type transporter Mla subunit MlaD